MHLNTVFAIFVEKGESMINVNISITINDNEIHQAYEYAKSKLACTPEEAKHIADEYTDKDVFYIFKHEVLDKIQQPNIAEHQLFEGFFKQNYNAMQALANTFIKCSENWIKYLEAQYYYRCNTQNFEDPFWQKAKKRSEDRGYGDRYIPEKTNLEFQQMI